MRLAQESGRIRKKTESRSEMKDSNRKTGTADSGKQSGSAENRGGFGADAVYIGGEAFGLRAKAKISKEDMPRESDLPTAMGKKVYVTANILAHNRDLDGARAYFRELKEIGPDALIISDPGMFTLARQEWPEVESIFQPRPIIRII